MAERAKTKQFFSAIFALGPCIYLLYHVLNVKITQVQRLAYTFSSALKPEYALSIDTLMLWPLRPLFYTSQH